MLETDTIFFKKIEFGQQLMKKIHFWHKNAEDSFQNVAKFHMWQNFHNFLNIWAKFVKYTLRKLRVSDKLFVGCICTPSGMIVGHPIGISLGKTIAPHNILKLGTVRIIGTL